ncbi:Dihem cytochrome c [Thioflavicoccus mobilis 8321]|uniref:Dihem cytochrome c n=1 Tax=Thioflavicoccus mobilis 8321 TaxID=765912 RepID=L0H2C3_9GAMM|nr:diheme cytochrome c [Thioflavicoccus mobilis]AGA92197.1 Dihem cytochrome c [Thioflavicoccus mobilis 8321]
MRTMTPALSLLASGLLALGTSTVAFGDSDRDDDDRRRSRPGVAPVTNATYREECGACHMAYQPNLLPARAWDDIMSLEALANHYGDDASLGNGTRTEIRNYLTNHAADEAGRFRSPALARASRSPAHAPEEALPRISATRYFRHEHDEIPDRLVSGNPEVMSLSQCNACHRGAEQGIYNEHQVDIPGAGRWDD